MVIKNRPRKIIVAVAPVGRNIKPPSVNTSRELEHAVVCTTNINVVGMNIQDIDSSVPGRIHGPYF